MRIGVLGTGSVGTTIAGRLRKLGHDVLIGSRTRGDDAVPFDEAAAHGEVVLNCTNGAASLEALRAAGAENLAGKVLIDVANPLDFSSGTLRLTVGVDDSLGEQIQREFPDARVVKALNTVNHLVMVDPASVPGEHVIFVAGDDEEAKATARQLLAEFGWTEERMIDLGDITAARATEAYLLLWVRLMGPIGGARFNIAIAR